MPKEGLLFNDFGSIQKACRIYGRLFGYSWKLLKYVEDGAKIKLQRPNLAWVSQCLREKDVYEKDVANRFDYCPLPVYLCLRQ